MSFWRNRHEVGGEELNAFVDGELDEVESRRVERHIASCASCGEAVAELRAVSRAVSELPANRAPRSFALREADLEAAEPAAPGGLFGSLQPLLSGVAAIAIITFVVLAGVDISSESSQSDSSSAPRTAGEVGSPAYSSADRNDLDGGDVGEDGTLALENEDAASDDARLPDSDFPRDEAEGRITSGALPPEEIEEAPQAGDSTERDAVAAHGNALVDDDGDGTGLRVAEGVAAAVAIAAGGSVVLIWWRRRAAAV